MRTLVFAWQIKAGRKFMKWWYLGWRLGTPRFIFCTCTIWMPGSRSGNWKWDLMIGGEERPGSARVKQLGVHEPALGGRSSLLSSSLSPLRDRHDSEEWTGLRDEWLRSVLFYELLNTLGPWGVP